MIKCELSTHRLCVCAHARTLFQVQIYGFVFWIRICCKYMQQFITHISIDSNRHVDIYIFISIHNWLIHKKAHISCVLSCVFFHCHVSALFQLLAFCSFIAFIFEQMSNVSIASPATTSLHSPHKHQAIFMNSHHIVY